MENGGGGGGKEEGEIIDDYMNVFAAADQFFTQGVKGYQPQPFLREQRVVAVEPIRIEQQQQQPSMDKNVIDFRLKLLLLTNDGKEAYSLERFAEELWSLKISEFSPNEQHAIAEASVCLNNTSILQHVEDTFGRSVFMSVRPDNMFELCIVRSACNSLDFLVERMEVPSLSFFFSIMFRDTGTDKDKNYTPALYHLFESGAMSKTHARECLDLDFSKVKLPDAHAKFVCWLRERFGIVLIDVLK